MKFPSIKQVNGWIIFSSGLSPGVLSHNQQDEEQSTDVSAVFLTAAWGFGLGLGKGHALCAMNNPFPKLYGGRINPIYDRSVVSRAK